MSSNSADGAGAQAGRGRSTDEVTPSGRPLDVRQRPARPGWGLARYVIASTLVRSVDGGAVVAIVLLARSVGLSSLASGLLAAAITAPHLLGPFVSRRLDTARDGRIVIAVSAIAHGTLLAIAALALTTTHPAVPAILLVVSGLFGPMVTAGVSSRLPSIAGPSLTSQRRAQGWDVASYGMSGTIGPALVGWMAAGPGPLAGTLALAGATVAGAAVIMLLPRQEPPADVASVPSMGKTIRIIAGSGPLRRTLGLTVTVAFSVATLPIYAVAAGPGFGGAALAGTLVAGYGVGNLLGSVGLMLWPLRGEADRLTAVLAGLVAVALAAVVAMPDFAASLVMFTLAGVANSLFFASTLAARSEYSPREVRGQVFIWVGALKIAAGSAGTAAAGALIGDVAWLPTAVVAALTGASAAYCFLERRIERSRA